MKPKRCSSPSTVRFLIVFLTVFNLLKLPNIVDKIVVPQHFPPQEQPAPKNLALWSAPTPTPRSSGLQIQSSLSMPDTPKPKPATVPVFEQKQSSSAAPIKRTAQTALKFSITKPLPELSKVPFPLGMNSSEPLWKQRSIMKQRGFYRVQQPVNDPQPRPPLEVFVKASSPAKRDRNPTIAVITSTRSTPRRQNNRTLLDNLIQSLRATITVEEQLYWNVQLYVAIDESDEWWQTHWKTELHLPDWMELVIGIYKDRKNFIPFNDIVYLAYNMSKPDYYCRVNDDSEFESTNWITKAVNALLDLNPPNVGVVGPTVKEGNSGIHTHDFVHATHLHIHAGSYYPPGFGNWYLDDWITNVYHKNVLGIDRCVWVKGWTMVHQTGGVMRYTPTQTDNQLLPFEYELGRNRIFAKIQELSGKQIPLTSTYFLPFARSSQKDVLEKVLQSVGTGNMLVWGLDKETSPWLFRNTLGKVFFLVGSDSNSKDLLNFGHHTYLEAKQVTFNTKLYGKHEETFQRLTSKDATKEDWKDLDMSSEFTTPLFWGDVHYQTIWVEGPMARGSGYKDEKGPATFQPIFMSNEVAQKQAQKNITTHIFVNNFHQSHEKAFSSRVFGVDPFEVLESNSGAAKVGHFIVKKQEPSSHKG